MEKIISLFWCSFLLISCSKYELNENKTEYSTVPKKLEIYIHEINFGEAEENGDFFKEILFNKTGNVKFKSTYSKDGKLLEKAVCFYKNSKLKEVRIYNDNGSLIQISTPVYNSDGILKSREVLDTKTNKKKEIQVISYSDSTFLFKAVEKGNDVYFAEDERGDLLRLRVAKGDSVILERTYYLEYDSLGLKKYKIEYDKFQEPVALYSYQYEFYAKDSLGL